MEPHPLAEILAILPMFHRDLVVQHLAVATKGIDLFTHVAGRHADCPSCETRSDRVHGRYVRRLADLAWQGNARARASASPPLPLRGRVGPSSSGSRPLLPRTLDGPDG
jgi:hypothetical protein